MNGVLWAGVTAALLISLAALGLTLVLSARYRQLHVRVMAMTGMGEVAYPDLGSGVPRFETSTVDGSPVDSASLDHGSAVVVVLDTNCATCKEILPEIAAFLAGRSDPVAPLALIGGDREAMAPYLAGLPSSVRVVGPASIELVSSFGVSAFPTILVYDAGRLVAVGSRPDEIAVPAAR